MSTFETREVTQQLLAAAVRDPDVLQAMADAANEHAALADVAQRLAAVAAGLMHRLAVELGCDVDELLKLALTLLDETDE